MSRRLSSLCAVVALVVVASLGSGGSALAASAAFGAAVGLEHTTVGLVVLPRSGQRIDRSGFIHDVDRVDVEQLAYGLDVSLRRLARARPGSGIQLGVDGDLHLGHAGTESPGGAAPSPVTMALGAAAVVRVHAFNVPFPGSLALRFGVRGEAGGGLWWSDGKRGWGLLGAECAFAPTPMSAIRLRWQVEGLAVGEGRAGERLDAPGQSASLLLGYDRVVVEAGWTSRSVISTRSQRFGTNRLDESAHSDERLLRLGVGWRF